ncbi:MAG: hypothetical protein QXD24_07515 [Candidatus Caldarchaeum sp.]
MRKTLTMTILVFFLAMPSIPVIAAQQSDEDPFAGAELWKQRPVLGAQPTLVAMVEFSDQKFRHSRAQVEEIIKIVDNFVRSGSYGRAWLEYYIHPKVITLPKPHSYYGAPSPGAQRGDDPARLIEYMKTSIDILKTREKIDITKYKHVILIHAGEDEADGTSPTNIWSVCYMGLDFQILLEKGYRFEELKEVYKKTQWAVYADAIDFLLHKKPDGSWHLLNGVETVAAEAGPFLASTIAHEFTHSMWISDHYVYGKDGYGVGNEVGVWTNMDYGPFLDPPVDIDGWSKYLLGWVEAVTVEKDGEYTIHTLDKPDEPHALIIPINDKEYYFIHARRPVKNDAALPSPGILVFRVNKYMWGNVVGEPFMVQLMDANQGPPECEEKSKQYSDSEGYMTLCVKFDAAYFSAPGITKSWTLKYVDGSSDGPFTINLSGFEFVSEEGFRVAVVSFDPDAGVARLRVGLGGKSGGETSVVTVTRTVTGTVTNTLYTTSSVVGTETRTVVVTVTTKQTPAPTYEGYISIAIILAALVMMLGLIASRRRRTLPPPPPPPPPQAR